MNQKNTNQEEKKNLTGLERKLANLKPIPKGQTLNPYGRPKGSKNFETYFKLAWKEIGQEISEGKKPSDGKLEIVKIGLKKMKKGDYQFWRDFMDRLFGKAPEQLEVIQKQLLIDLTEPAKEKFQERQKEDETGN